MNYKLLKDKETNQIYGVMRSDGWSFVFDPANTDYANFKRDIEDGAELQDADGNVMSVEATKEFVRGLP